MNQRNSCVITQMSRKMSASSEAYVFLKALFYFLIPYFHHIVQADEIELYYQSFETTPVCNIVSNNKLKILFITE